MVESPPCPSGPGLRRKVSAHHPVGMPERGTGRIHASREMIRNVIQCWEGVYMVAFDSNSTGIVESEKRGQSRLPMGANWNTTDCQLLSSTYREGLHGNHLLLASLVLLLHLLQFLHEILPLGKCHNLGALLDHTLHSTATNHHTMRCHHCTNTALSWEHENGPHVKVAEQWNAVKCNLFVHNSPRILSQTCNSSKLQMVHHCAGDSSSQVSSSSPPAPEPFSSAND